MQIPSDYQELRPDANHSGDVNTKIKRKHVLLKEKKETKNALFIPENEEKVNDAYREVVSGNNTESLGETSRHQKNTIKGLNEVEEPTKVLESCCTGNVLQARKVERDRDSNDNKKGTESSNNTTNEDIEKDCAKMDLCGDTDEMISIDVIYPGTDLSPGDGNVVKIHYTIALALDKDTLESSPIIESSRERCGRAAFTFIMGQGLVIPGWEMALKQMKREEISKVEIPPKYAYGSSGLPPCIPPNSKLICQIELIDFWDQPKVFKPWIQELEPNMQK